MPRAQGARAQLAAGFETTYGTAPAAGKFWRMPFVSSGLGSEQPLIGNDLLGYGRDPLAPVKDAVTADGDVVVPIDSRLLGVWLKALFGSPTTTGAAAPYSHEFATGKYALPSLSIEIGNPEVPSYRMMRGVKANSINWSFATTGLVSATVACIAQGEDASAAASKAGALEDLPVARFSSFNGSIKRNGVRLANVTAGSVTYTNNLDAVRTIRDDGLIDGADEGMAMLSGEITARFADTTLLELARDGTPTELSFGYSDGTHSFDLTAHAVYLPRPRISISGPAGIDVTFAWQAAQDPVTGRMATITLVNDVQNYSNPA